jgi:hypothetical protein
MAIGEQEKSVFLGDAEIARIKKSRDVVVQEAMVVCWSTITSLNLSIKNREDKNISEKEEPWVKNVLLYLIKANITREEIVKYLLKNDQNEFSNLITVKFYDDLKSETKNPLQKKQKVIFENKEEDQLLNLSQQITEIEGREIKDNLEEKISLNLELSTLRIKKIFLLLEINKLTITSETLEFFDNLSKNILCLQKIIDNQSPTNSDYLQDQLVKYSDIKEKWSSLKGIIYNTTDKCELRDQIWQNPEAYTNEHKRTPRNYNPPKKVILKIESLLKRNIPEDEIVTRIDFPSHFSKKKVETIINKCKIIILETPVVLDLVKKRYTFQQIHDYTGIPVTHISHIVETNISKEELNGLQLLKIADRKKDQIAETIPIIKSYIEQYRSIEYIAKETKLDRKKVITAAKKILKDKYGEYIRKINSIGHLKLKYPIFDSIQQIDRMINEEHKTRVQIIDLLSLSDLSFKALYELREGFDYEKYINEINPQNEIYQRYHKNFQYIFENYKKISIYKIAKNINIKIETLKRILDSNTYKEFESNLACANSAEIRTNLY